MKYLVVCPQILDKFSHFDATPTFDAEIVVQKVLD